MLANEISKRLEGNKDLQVAFMVSSATEKEICAILKKADKSKKAKISASLLEIAKNYPDAIHLTISDVFELRQNYHLTSKMLRAGKVLAGEIPDVSMKQLKLEPFVILSYDLSKLSQKEKMLIKREIYGKKTQKNYKGKVYLSQKQGLLEKLGGKRAGKATLLLNQSASEELERALRQHGAITNKMDIWLGK